VATSLKYVGGIKPHPSVVKLNEDHPLNLKDVRDWLIHNEELAREHAKNARRGAKKSIAQRYIHEGYVKDIRSYLRHGDWISDFFGKNQEHKIKWRTVAS